MEKLLALLSFLAWAGDARGAGLASQLRAPAGTKLEELVVWAKAPPPGMAAGTGVATVTQRSNEFAPKAFAVAAGAKVQFENFDKVAHNVFSLSPAEKFDLGMHLPNGNPLEHSFRNPGRVQVFCNIHPGMHLVLNVLSHGAHARPGPDGRFSLPWKGKRPARWEGLVDGPGWPEPRPVGFRWVGKEFQGELAEKPAAKLPAHTRKDGSAYPKAEGSGERAY